MLTLLCLLFSNSPGLAADLLTLESPDGNVRLQFLTREGQLHHQATFRGQPLIELSPLRFSIDDTPLTAAVEPGAVEKYEINETYPWRGVHSQATNHCHGATLTLRDTDSGSSFSLEARVFNDGLAFRHLIPGDSDRSRIPDESTRFLIPAGSTVWYHGLGGHYEAVHDRKDIADVDDGSWAAPPVTFELPGDIGYASITEAALVNYSGMALQADGRRGFSVVLGHKHPVSYPFELRYEDDIERVSQPAAIRGAIQSPWRVVLVGPDLNTLVNADVIHNLCPPPDPELFPDGLHTGWIKPGRAVWRYLDGGDRSLDGIKNFSRWAGELGFEHHVIEGFWRRWSDEELRDLVDHSREHGVGLWFWRHSRELRTPEARKEFFSRLQSLGVAGAKIDFFDHEHREIVDLYPALLEEAARHRIMVNFHGSNKPTGEPRTWPNELIRESVRGMESSRLRARASHNTTLPFTRYLAGHGDYTPVHFGERRGDTTWTHQIATAAIFDDPLLTYAAHPETLLNHPAVDMIKAIPAVWDESRVLPPSRIGELTAFARRSGNTWFLAIMNGPSSNNVRVSLDFLGNGVHQTLEVHDHADDPAAIRIVNGRASNTDALTLDLRAGGGYIARYTSQ
jgi:alpha-glucosidase